MSDITIQYGDSTEEYESPATLQTAGKLMANNLILTASGGSGKISDVNIIYGDCITIPWENTKEINIDREIEELTDGTILVCHFFHGVMRQSGLVIPIEFELYYDNTLIGDSGSPAYGYKDGLISSYFSFDYHTEAVFVYKEDYGWLLIGPNCADAMFTSYGQCVTSGDWSIKQIELQAYDSDRVEPNVGMLISVDFSEPNTADNPVLQVNAMTEIPVRYKGNEVTTGFEKYLLKGTCLFVFDGTYWALVNCSDYDWAGEITEEPAEVIDITDLGSEYFWAGSDGEWNNVVYNEFGSINLEDASSSSKKVVESLSDNVDEYYYIAAALTESDWLNGNFMFEGIGKVISTLYDGVGIAIDNGDLLVIRTGFEKYVYVFSNTSPGVTFNDIPKYITLNKKKFVPTDTFEIIHNELNKYVKSMEWAGQFEDGLVFNLYPNPSVWIESFYETSEPEEVADKAHFYSNTDNSSGWPTTMPGIGSLIDEIGFNIFIAENDNEANYIIREVDSNGVVILEAKPSFIDHTFYAGPDSEYRFAFMYNRGDDVVYVSGDEMILATDSSSPELPIRIYLYRKDCYFTPTNEFENVMNIMTSAYKSHYIAANAYNLSNFDVTQDVIGVAVPGSGGEGGGGSPYTDLSTEDIQTLLSETNSYNFSVLGDLQRKTNIKLYIKYYTSENYTATSGHGQSIDVAELTGATIGIKDSNNVYLEPVLYFGSTKVIPDSVTSPSSGAKMVITSYRVPIYRQGVEPGNPATNDWNPNYIGSWNGLYPGKVYINRKIIPLT